METILRFLFSRSIIFKLLGVGLMIVGAILTPIIIGIPIMFFGWLIALTGFLLQFTDLIPKQLRDRLASKVKESYKPYHQAATSLAVAGGEMLRIAFIVFMFLVIGAGAVTKKLGWW